MLDGARSEPVSPARTAQSFEKSAALKPEGTAQEPAGKFCGIAAQVGGVLHVGRTLQDGPTFERSAPVLAGGVGGEIVADEAAQGGQSCSIPASYLCLEDRSFVDNTPATKQRTPTSPTRRGVANEMPQIDVVSAVILSECENRGSPILTI